MVSGKRAIGLSECYWLYPCTFTGQDRSAVGSFIFLCFSEKTWPLTQTIAISSYLYFPSPSQQVKFLYDGQRIAADDTPSKLDMEDNDSIDVVIEQVRLSLLSRHLTQWTHNWQLGLLLPTGWRTIDIDSQSESSFPRPSVETNFPTILLIPTVSGCTVPCRRRCDWLMFCTSSKGISFSFSRFSPLSYNTFKCFWWPTYDIALLQFAFH